MYIIWPDMQHYDRMGDFAESALEQTTWELTDTVAHLRLIVASPEKVEST
jgi:hypothetical protein